MNEHHQLNIEKIGDEYFVSIQDLITMFAANPYSQVFAEEFTKLKEEAAKLKWEELPNESA